MSDPHFVQVNGSKRQRLQTEAFSCARERGHNMTLFEKVRFPFLYRSKCLDCRMEMDVNLQPKANETWISGEAVALECKGREKVRR
ncbi:MAG: hypothetical protein RBT66_09195 [bacterium]|nr:hypothetical protein [bacterium]